MRSGIAALAITVTTISVALTVASTLPAKANAAARPLVSRNRIHAGTSAAFRAPSASIRRTTLMS